MARSARANRSGMVRVRVHNPAGARFTLGLPGERRKNMAKKKSKSRRGKSKKNPSARVGGNSTALALFKAGQQSVQRKSNPKRKHKKSRKGRHGKKRNPSRAIARRRSNPFGGKFFGLSVNDLLGGAVGYVGDELVSLLAAGIFGVNPNGGIGLLVRGGGVVAMGKWLPKSIGPAAVIVSGAKVVVSIDDTYLGFRRKLLGTAKGFIPGQAGGNGAQQQTGGYVTS